MLNCYYSSSCSLLIIFLENIPRHRIAGSKRMLVFRVVFLFFFFNHSLPKCPPEKLCQLTELPAVCEEKDQKNVSSEWCPFTILSTMSIITKEWEGERTQRKKKSCRSNGAGWGGQGGGKSLNDGLLSSEVEHFLFSIGHCFLPSFGNWSAQVFCYFFFCWNICWCFNNQATTQFKKSWSILHGRQFL